MELIIADDCSTDGTCERLRKRLEDVKFKVKFLSSDKNLGLGKNYHRGFSACSGEFIAFLEGDDYWTDPYRLQKHIDFLEINPRCGMTFNPYAIFLQKNGGLILPELNVKQEVKFYSSKWLIQYNVIGNLSACVFRRSALEGVSRLWLIHYITDWFLGIYMAEKHRVAQLNEVMSVYRINAKGLWSRLSKEEQSKNKSNLTFTYDLLLGFRFSHDFLAYRLASRIKNGRDSLKEKLPKRLGSGVTKIISQGLIIRFSLFLAYMTPKKMISRNDEVYKIF